MRPTTTLHSRFARSPSIVRAEEGDSAKRLRPNITSTRPPRQTAPPPEQVPVEHSTSFVLRSTRPTDEEEEIDVRTSSRADQPFTGNAIEWYLKRLDKSFDEGDADVSPAAKAYYNASQTKAGSSAAKGMGSVVGTAAKVGANAVKAAAPIGKWAVLQGLGAAGRMIMPSSKRRSGDKDKDSGQ